MADVAAPDKLLDCQEVADWLDVPLSWVQTAARTKELPSVPIGRYYRFDREDIEEWIRARKTGR
jgi:excisionase family DNA binding protein